MRLYRIQNGRYCLILLASKLQRKMQQRCFIDEQVMMLEYRKVGWGSEEGLPRVLELGGGGVPCSMRFSGNIFHSTYWYEWKQSIKGRNPRRYHKSLLRSREDPSMIANSPFRIVSSGGFHSNMGRLRAQRRSWSCNSKFPFLKYWLPLPKVAWMPASQQNYCRQEFVVLEPSNHALRMSLKADSSWARVWSCFGCFTHLTLI